MYALLPEDVPAEQGATFHGGPLFYFRLLIPASVRQVRVFDLNDPLSYGEGQSRLRGAGDSDAVQFFEDSGFDFFHFSTPRLDFFDCLGLPREPIVLAPSSDGLLKIERDRRSEC
jgi:hypothetical protein